MDNINGAQVYQFIENKYDEVEQRDDGSYPKKQDPEVMRAASEHFSLSLDEVSSIFDIHSQHATDIEMKRINKLPEAARKKVLEKRFKEIMCNNKDNDFHKHWGENTGPLPKGLDFFTEEYETIFNDIGEHGWVIPKIMGLEKLNALTKLEIDKYDDFFSEFYKKNILKTIVGHIRKSGFSKINMTTFDEAFDAFSRRSYNIAAIGFVSILEGALSTVQDDPKNIRMMMVCKNKRDTASDSGKKIDYLIWSSYYKFVSELYKKSDFDSSEPDSINRHWLMHGRTLNDLTRMDCLKILNALHCIVTISKVKI